MAPYTRKKFLQTSALLASISLLLPSSIGKKKPLRLSFSTLGCPDWNFEKIIGFASAHGYQGLELRGLQRELDLTKCKEFNSPETLAASLALMKKNKLSFVSLGASCNLHIAEPVERKKNLDEARRFIDLAAKIDCPYIRVFPNKLPQGPEKQATIDLIVQGLLELGEYASTASVIVLMETHGDVVKADDLLQIMQAAEHKHTGLVWDISNMWTVTKEPPAEVYQKLKKYIHHTHIKDARLVNEKLQYVLLGKGEVPIFEAIDILAKDKYRGYYSFEWEKLWHPEIAEPELALADYPLAMKQHFNK